MAEHNRILVGVIGAPHGVRGELRLKSYTADPEGIADYQPLSSEDGRRQFTIQSLRPIKADMLVVRFKEVADRTAAEALTNLRLFVDRSVLPAPDADEIYQADLIGLRAETEAGALVGTVIAVQNFGAGDLLEIAPGHGDTILVPFTHAFVPHLDVPAGRLVVSEAVLASDETDPPDDPHG